MNERKAEVWIPLTKGKVTVIDFEDFEKVRGIKWYAQANGGGKFYAANDSKRGGVRKIIFMHRLLLGDLGKLDGDHKNGNSLDNRRENLRPATRAQNISNKKILPSWKNCAYRGVCLHSKNGNWTAQITIAKKKKHLGSFSNPEDAARAYDAAAKKQSGEFANLNFYD